MNRPQRKMKEPGPVTQVTAPVKTGEAVTVACKHPSGLILRIYKMEGSTELVMGGGHRTVQKAKQIGEQVIIRGPAIPFGVVPDYRIVGGYALTEGVDGEFWDAWVMQNADSDIVKNRMIYAAERTLHVVGQAKEQSALLSGMEPINPVKDPRNVQPRNRNITAIESAARV